MRIGFVTQLLWDRYGDFWVRLLEDAGAQIEFPDPERTLSLFADDRVKRASGTGLKLAVAQALALAHTDLILAPALNHAAESTRGGGQDPWIADFPAALATTGGLPRVTGVPAWLDAGFKGRVVEILQTVTHDPGSTRRLLDRHRSGLRTGGKPRPRGGDANPPAGALGIAVLGQPWNLVSDVLAVVTPEGAYPLLQNELAPDRLREEGERADPKAIPSDQEVLGAARLLSRRGSVAELHMIVDEESGSDLWLVDRVDRLSHKPVVRRSLAELLEGQPDRLLQIPASTGGA